MMLVAQLASRLLALGTVIVILHSLGAGRLRPDADRDHLWGDRLGGRRPGPQHPLPPRGGPPSPAGRPLPRQHALAADPAALPRHPGADRCALAARAALADRGLGRAHGRVRPPAPPPQHLLRTPAGQVGGRRDPPRGPPAARAGGPRRAPRPRHRLLHLGLHLQLPGGGRLLRHRASAHRHLAAALAIRDGADPALDGDDRAARDQLCLHHRLLADRRPHPPALRRVHPHRLPEPHQPQLLRGGLVPGGLQALPGSAGDPLRAPHRGLPTARRVPP